MDNFDATPMVAQVLGHEAPVAMMRLLLAAKEACVADNVARDHVLDAPSSDEFYELLFVGRPIAFRLFIGIEERLCGSENRQMDVVHSADGVEEIPKIITFREPSQLRDVVQANIDNPLRAGLPERRKELFGRLFREPDREDPH